MVKRWGMVIDLRRCVGCLACTIACQEGNQVPLGQFWNLVLTVGPTGTYPNIGGMHYFSRLCMHCADAPCVKGCPTTASHYRPDGIVIVDPEKCIGCKYCLVSCPYGARYFNEKTGVVQKCEFCYKRLDQGGQPLCVTTCPQKARTFGDIGDPSSEISRLIHSQNAVPLFEEGGTNPGVYYIRVD
jgi:Fe-S-cluster-containing dehydrogenase component